MTINYNIGKYYLFILAQFLMDSHAVRTYDTLSLNRVMQYSLILTDFNLICFQLYIKIYIHNKLQTHACKSLAPAAISTLK